MATKVLLLVGSGRPHSDTKALGNAIERSLQARGATTVLLDLLAADIPNVDPKYHRDPAENPDPRIQNLVEQSNLADAFVFLTPIYHNSFSGLLKNTLDNLAVAQFSGKVIGLGSNGGNRTTQAVDQLRIVSRALNALVIPTQVCTQETDFAGEEMNAALSDETMLERVERFTEELVRVSEALRAGR